jgi:hypothetical protein
VVQRANSLTGGRAFDPEPWQPLFHSRDWCFTPLPGFGWQVLFDSQHGLIGSEKSDTLQKLVAGKPEPDPQKIKNIRYCQILIKVKSNKILCDVKCYVIRITW